MLSATYDNSTLLFIISRSRYIYFPLVKFYAAETETYDSARLPFR